MRNPSFASSFSRTLAWGAFLTMTSSVLLSQDPAPPPAGGGAGGGGGATTGPSIPGGGGTGGTTGGTVGRPGTNPGQQSPQDPRNQQQQRFPEMQRPIFLSGKVVMDDGTPPPDPVTIERMCNGNIRPEGYTDSKGRFSFQLGQNNGMFADASISNTNDPFGDPNRGGTGGFGNTGGMGGRQISERDLMGCELRASLPGHRSEIVPLSGRRFMDNPDVGTIILRRLGNVEGLTVSVTSAAAPKDARKAYEKGRDLARRQKWADAQKELEKAVAVYPKYANAWQDLGLVHESQQRTEEARKAYASALEADPKLVKPYVQMAWMWARENKWQECADASGRAVKLNPFDYPQAYFVNAVANMNLQKFDAAEKSAQEGVKLDEQNRIPKLRHVLGLAMAQKGEYAGAVEHMKSYLKLLPFDSPEKTQVTNQLAQMEKFAVAQPKPAGQQ